MIKCIAVDDEPLALEQLTGYIARVPFLQLIASCQDAFSAMQVLSEDHLALIVHNDSNIVPKEAFH